MTGRIACWAALGCLWVASCSTGGGAATQPLDQGPFPDAAVDPGPAGDEATSGDEVSPGDVAEGVLDAMDGADADVPDLWDVEAGCAVDADCAGKISGLLPCEVAKCLGGQCGRRAADDHAPCDDGDACTDGETCLNGECLGGTARACDDGKACTVDYCKAGEGCRNDALSGPCSDGSACTEGDTCVAGECVGSKVDCNDLNPCTIDSCAPATGCVHEKVLSGTCDDGSVCTLGETCVDGECKGTKADCDDHNVCTTDTCDPVGSCQHEAAAGKCDDGKTCTTRDACKEGVCSGTPIDCDDGDPCTDDLCEEGSGCKHPYNTAACDDLNPCTTGDACFQGTCGGTPVTCEGKANECDGSVLTSYGKPGVCVDGTCAYLKQVVTCTQGCASGQCVGNPCEGLDCSAPPGTCFGVGTCGEGQCNYPYLARGAPCSEGKACTGPDACWDGVCAGAPVVCKEPPTNECLDAKTLKAWRKGGTCDEPGGTCTYDWAPVDCSGGCVDAVCVEALGLLQAELTSGGQLGMSAGTNEMSCVMPGWAEPVTMQVGTFRVTAGFEP